MADASPAPHDAPRPQPVTRRASADAALFDDGGRILLQRRRDVGLWGLPGGAIELDESAAQTAVREVREETGYEAAVVRLVGVYTDPSHTTFRYPDGNVVQYVSLLFECRLTGGHARTQWAEATDMRWFAADALPPDVLADHRVRIADAFARRPEACVR
jgi:8-oxo-dGTP pyrophosphatase MutT (NUDIX family)